MHVKHTKYKLIFSIIFFVLADLAVAYTLGSGTCEVGVVCDPWYYFIFNRTALISSVIAAFLFYTIWSFFEERKY